jgi:predicted nucleic acid-binding protein
VTVELGVLDASVAVKCFLDEAGSAEARRAVGRPINWIAPDLIFLEVVSVALKTIRRGLIHPTAGAAMVNGVAGLLAETAPAAELCADAFRMAANHGFSAYDAAYLALAERRRTQLLTADLRLADLAEASGLGSLVSRL